MEEEQSDAGQGVGVPELSDSAMNYHTIMNIAFIGC